MKTTKIIRPLFSLALTGLLLTLSASASVPPLNLGGLTPIATAQQANANAAQELSTLNAENLKLAYHPSRAAHPAIVSAITLKDAQRNVSIPLKIYYPKTLTGPAPVILFSHGGGLANNDFYKYLGTKYAEYGYIAIHPTHPSNSLDTVRTLYQQGTPPSEIVHQVVSPEAIASVVKDITFIIDAFPTVESQIPALKGKMNKNAIGMGGHSQGGVSALVASGANITLSNGSKANLSEPRITAFLAISAGGISPTHTKLGIDYPSMKNVTRPMMVVTGTQDTALVEHYIKNLDPYFLSPATQSKFAIVSKDSDHQDFAGVSFQEGGLLNALAITQNSSLAFFDAMLRKDAAAQTYLKSGIKAFIGSRKSAVVSK